MTVRRLLPLSGIVFVVLLVIAVVGLGGDTPESKASAADVATFYGDESGRQFIAAFVLAATAPFVVLFASSFASRQWPDDHHHASVWQRVLVAGSAVTAAASVIAALLHFALADGADQNVSPTALQALNVLDANAWVPFNSGLGVMMLGAAGLLLTGALIPRWLGWLALILSVALFIPWADFIALIISLVWIIVVSVMFYRTGADEGREQPAIL
jgi:hypothetical protein